ncbi:ATP-binding cassette domain-containing protein [Nocardioides zeae]|uniref:ATP-binding cassette domain-containing protein n=1 Tax=Nocardioides imazamoxiresistens TaxID=3231893 RepID=A0ABU3PSG2_9ACTN|nr:ATP-binding cassette domain-containing protein [Nocardioides zeae]MDT9592147.1 ATP-binding cassette domain-containing protein [Nocardioides zeae]
MLTELLPFVVAGVATGAILGIAGTGLVLTYKTSGIFNIGHGAVAAAAAYVFYFLHVEQELPWIPAFLLAVVVLGPVFGLVMAAISRSLAEQRAAMKIVATIGLILIVQGLATVKYGYNGLQVPQYLPNGLQTFELGGVFVSYAQVTVIGISLVAVGALFVFFRTSRTGLAMRAVVNDPELVGLHGTSPQRVQRLAWVIGATFAALSGVLIAPVSGLESVALTFLVVQAFGAAAVGAFSSIPLTYVGALVIGVAASLTTKYALELPELAGLPASLPFVFLIVALLVLPKSRLVAPARNERAPNVPWHGPTSSRLVAGVVVVGALALVPTFAGAKLTYFTTGLTQAIMLLSLGLLIRTAGMVSLCHAAFAAIGAAAFAQFAGDAGMPWLVALMLGAFVVVPVAALLALPAIRLSGLFLALATLGFGLMVEQLLYFRDFFFTQTGIGREMPRPSGFKSDDRYYYVVLAFFVATGVAMMLIHRGRLGRVLQGLSESPQAVRTLGLNVNLTRLIVFCVSGFFAGVAGILYGASANYAALGDPQFMAYQSLVLVATLALMPFREPWYAVMGIAAAVIPAYIHGESTAAWMNVLFGFFAIVTATQGGTPAMPAPVRRAVDRVFRSRRPKPAPTRVATDGEGYRLRDGASGLEVRDLTIRYGGRTAVDAVSFTAPVGQITGLIGPNGAGKTTTFNAVSGLLSPSEGAVLLHGSEVTSLSPGARGRRGLGRTFQLMQLADSLTVAQNVELGVESGLAGSSVRGQLVASPAERRATVAAAERAMELCGITHLRDQHTGALSTGQRRLVELARCLAGPFDLLLLDEPSSGLDPVETEQFGSTLERVVAERGCGILLVEHDMALVLRICREIHVLDFGKLLFHGTPTEVRTSPVVQAAYLGSAEIIEEELDQSVQEGLVR